MPDFSIFREWSPQAYGVWTGVMLYGGWLFKGWLETRKLSIQDRQANREGFARQVENLQGENRSLQHDLSSLRREYDEYRKLCHHETDQLRGQVIQLESEMVGMRRKFDQAQATFARQLGITNEES